MTQVEIIYDEIPALTGRVLRRVEALTATTREEILKRAQELAPEGDPRHGDVDPGNLRESGHIDGDAVVFDGDYSQAVFNEFGTRDMAPQPFLGPACQDVDPAFQVGMRELIIR